METTTKRSNPLAKVMNSRRHMAALGEAAIWLAAVEIESVTMQTRRCWETISLLSS